MGGGDGTVVPIVQNNLKQVVRLCRQHHVRRMELFGSAAEDRFNLAKSDLDFLVEFEPATPVEHATRYFALLAALQDLFQRNIDLVEARAVRNPYFLSGIQTSRTLVYAA